MVEKIINFVKAIIGCQFATLVYESAVSLPSKSGLKGRVSKLVKVTCQVNYSYQNAVNNRLDAIGETAGFVAQSLPWGAWLIPNKIIVHKDNYYLRFYAFEGSQWDITYFVDGVKATDSQIAVIKGFLPKKKESVRQAEVGLTEHQVTPMTVNVGNILSLTCNGQTISPQTETIAE